MVYLGQEMSELFKVGNINHLMTFINFYHVQQCCRGWTDGWMDGWMDELTFTVFSEKYFDCLPLKFNSYEVFRTPKMISKFLRTFW